MITLEYTIAVKKQQPCHLWSPHCQVHYRYWASSLLQTYIYLVLIYCTEYLKLSVNANRFHPPTHIQITVVTALWRFTNLRVENKESAQARICCLLNLSLFRTRSLRYQLATACCLIANAVNCLINFSPPQNLLLATKPERCLRGSAKHKSRTNVARAQTGLASRGPRDLTIYYSVYGHG